MGINVGNPIGADAIGGGLRHFQLFQESGSELVNSMEMHSDGTVYIAYTPQLWPRWYATFGHFEPNEAEDHVNDDLQVANGTARLANLKRQNVHVDQPYLLTPPIPPTPNSGRKECSSVEVRDLPC